MGPTFVYVAALMLVIFSTSCDESRERPSFLDIPEERSELISGIESYSSIDQINALLGDAAKNWDIIENSGKPSSNDSRPPFKIFTAVVHEYEYLGFTGDLKLSFFNDRLMSTVFYPTDFNGFVTRVRLTLPNLKEINPETLPPATQVTIGTDYQKKQYVSWEDVRLVEEFSIWIRRYS